MDRTPKYVFWAVVGFLIIFFAVLFSPGQHPGMDAEAIEVASIDLDSILTRDTLRVITRNHPLMYYLYRGARRGFEYELIKKFAEEQNIHLQVVVPPRFEDMVPYLLEGRGDIIAAMLTRTEERSGIINFSNPYLEVRQVLVGTEEHPPPRTMDELEGRTIVVRRGSSYEERLRELQRQGLNVIIQSPIDSLNDEEPVELVARGLAELTIVDNVIARMEQSFFPNLQIGISITESQQIAWAVRPNAPELQETLDEFLSRYRKSSYFAILQRRYFNHSERFIRHRSAQLALRTEGKISRYDHIFKHAGERYGFDWRFLAAVSYIESGFYPDAKSWAGAIGLMQLMPTTGEELGVDNLYDPSQNIFGGSRYMKFLYNQFEDVENEMDRLAFSIGSYNVGWGHVQDARRWAQDHGQDGDSWKTVRNVMAQFDQPEYYQGSRNGYFRGKYVVEYVDNVMDRYIAFCSLVPQNAEDEIEGPVRLAQK